MADPVLSNDNNKLMYKGNSKVASIAPRKRALKQFGPISLVRMVWKHKVLACIVWLTITAIAAFIIKSLPNVYEAVAVVLVDSQKIPEKFVASTVQVSLQDSLSAISKQVMSQQQLVGIVRDLHLYEEERKTKTIDEVLEHFRKDLTVTMDHGFGGGQRSAAFRIGYQGPNAQIVAAVVNRVTDLFIRENVETRQERAAGTSDFIESQLAQAKRQLDQMEESVSQFKIRYSGELPQQEGAIGATLSRLQSQLDSCQQAIARGQQNKLLLESTLNFAESSLEAATRAAKSAAIAPALPSDRAGQSDSDTAVPVRRSSEVIQAQLAAARQRYQEGHPEVRRLEGQLKAQLAAEASLLASGAAGGSGETKTSRAAKAPAWTPPPTVPTELLTEIARGKERVHNTKTQLDLLQAELQARDRERQDVLQQIAQYQSRIEKLPIREQQLAAITRDYAMAKANYQSFLDKKMSAQIANDMERSQLSERFAVADPAHVPEKPVKPKRMVMYLGSSVFALALGLALGIALELRKDVLLGEWELPQDIQILGRIGKIEPAPAARGHLSGAAALTAFLFMLMTSAAASAQARIGDWF